QKRLADVWNIASDFLRAKLGVARFDLEFFDMNRSVVVVFDETLRNEDRVFKVVTAPRHEGDEHIAAERQFPLIRARTIRQHLPFQNAVALADDRLLIDAGVLVGSLEFRQRVDIGADFARKVTVFRRLDAYDNSLGIDRIDDAVSAAN